MLIAPTAKNRIPATIGFLFLNIKIVGTNTTTLNTTPIIVEI